MKHIDKSQTLKYNVQNTKTSKKIYYYRKKTDNIRKYAQKITEKYMKLAEMSKNYCN